MPNEAINPVFRWRYVDSFDEEGEYEVAVLRCIEIRKTSKGAWCKQAYGYRKWGDASDSPLRWAVTGKEFFVLDGTGRRRYHQTLKDAWRSYGHRKIAQGQRARAALAASEAGIKIYEETAALGADYPVVATINSRY